MYQIQNGISCLKHLSYFDGGKGKLNVNFLSITLGYLIKNVQMKSYDFIINKCKFHPIHSMALRTH